MQEWTQSYIVIVPDRIDDGDVAFRSHEQNVVGRRNHEIPQRQSRQPDTTNELIADTVRRHASAIHLDELLQ